MAGQATQEENANMVEIGTKGSAIRVTRKQWDTAEEQSTFTSMALSLVSSLFDSDVLLKSNVKGGRSKIHKAEDGAPHHQKLDKHILEAISVSVKRKFPLRFK